MQIPQCRYENIHLARALNQFELDSSSLCRFKRQLASHWSGPPSGHFLLAESGGASSDWATGEPEGALTELAPATESWAIGRIA